MTTDSLSVDGRGAEKTSMTVRIIVVETEAVAVAAIVAADPIPITGMGDGEGDRPQHPVLPVLQAPVPRIQIHLLDRSQITMI
jgi:hypothetical protein